jgi:hypothetical protein
VDRLISDWVVPGGRLRAGALATLCRCGRGARRAGSQQAEKRALAATRPAASIVPSERAHEIAHPGSPPARALARLRGRGSAAGHQAPHSLHKPLSAGLLGLPPELARRAGTGSRGRASEAPPRLRITGTARGTPGRLPLTSGAARKASLPQHDGLAPPFCFSSCHGGPPLTRLRDRDCVPRSRVIQTDWLRIRNPGHPRRVGRNVADPAESRRRGRIRLHASQARGRWFEPSRAHAGVPGPNSQLPSLLQHLHPPDQSQNQLE